MMYETAAQCWQRLNSIKTSLMNRSERYAALTIAKLCLPDGYDPMSTDETHDYQSIGAQALNHLTNKVMLALFAPSRPFFRVDANDKVLADAAQAGIQKEDISTILSEMERKAVKLLDERAQRPKLYAVVRHLIAIGNVLLVLGKDSMRVMGLRYYCVKRDSEGKLHTLVVKEEVRFDELDEKAQAATAGKYHSDTKVCHYRHIVRQPNGDYLMTQWVNEHRLPKEFDGKWPEKKLPYRVLTWDLADESDYGTGLVEEYAGDLEACSALSESVVDGAILGCEMRWVVNPTGQTSARELGDSKNGAAIPGRPGDIEPVQGGNYNAVKIANDVLEKYERRISLGFLMMSGVTRQAERVTAEEVRLTANELETAYGGVYSNLSNQIQGPVADWLLEANGTGIKGTDLKVSVITGLDALSRNGDLENLRLALSDLAGLANTPPGLQSRIRWTPMSKFVGDGRGVRLLDFIKTDEELQQEMAQAQQSRVAEESAIEAGKAQAQGTSQ